MIKLLKNANVYSPAFLGKKDVLVADEKICLVKDKIEGYEGLDGVEVFDLTGKTLGPGYIEMHVHITGGGGEAGFSSRVPESQLSAFVKNGISTAVGLLGTDGITRSLENLVAKAQGLNEEGMTVYTLTGSYAFPSVTLTGSIEKDIVMVRPMVGVKIAVSDHRGDNPTGEDLIDAAVAARRGGLLSGTAGLVTIHMGRGKGKLDPIFYALDHSDLPLKTLLPTHMLYSWDLLNEGIKLIRRGGYIDCSTPSTPDRLEEKTDMLMELLRTEGVSADHVSMSSDSFGSLPRFDENGQCVGMIYATPEYMHGVIRRMVQKGFALEEALKLVTTTPASLLCLDGKKGCIAENADADLLVLDENLNIESFFLRGKTALWKGEVKMKGRFE